MSIVSVIFGIFIFIILVFVIVLLLAYFLLPVYFLKYAKDYDGSYEPSEDPYIINSWHTEITENFRIINDLDIQFVEKTSSWNILCNNQEIFTQLGVWIDIDGIRYSNNSLLYGGIPLEVKETRIHQESTMNNIRCEKILEVHFTHKNHRKSIITRIGISQSEKCIIFMLSTPESINLRNSQEKTSINYVFPSFRNESSLRRTLSYEDSVFCPPRRNFNKTKGPVIFFNDKRDCVIFSALHDFLISPTTKKDLPNGQTIEFGINSEIFDLPGNYSHESIMIFGQGIKENFKKWAEILYKFHNLEKKSLNLDIPTTFLGYYTDNGAAYYYMKEKGKKSDETLIALNSIGTQENQDW